MTQLRMGLRWSLGLLVAVGLLGMAGGARGQSLDSGSVGQAAEPRTYGAVAKTFLALTPWDFHPVASNTTYALNSSAIGQTKFRTGGAQLFKAPVHLPAGALVTEVAIVFCDTSSATGFGSSFFTQPRMALASFVVLAVSTNAEAPGCVDTTVTFTTPVQIDNNANSYHIEIVMGAADATIQFASARVGYVLQVSPAPAVATFSDVPSSHPFFRFIEALARSGITSGCGGGNFCPDAPLTRGQMAVFLSLGLGLHFAP
jgi:S-layer homology domain